MWTRWYKNKSPANNEDALRIKASIDALNCEIQIMQMKMTNEGYHPIFNTMAENFCRIPKILSAQSLKAKAKLKAVVRRNINTPSTKLNAGGNDKQRNVMKWQKSKDKIPSATTNKAANKSMSIVKANTSEKELVRAKSSAASKKLVNNAGKLSSNSISHKQSNMSNRALVAAGPSNTRSVTVIQLNNVKTNAEKMHQNKLSKQQGKLSSSSIISHKQQANMRDRALVAVAQTNKLSKQQGKLSSNSISHKQQPNMSNRALVAVGPASTRSITVMQLTNTNTKKMHQNKLSPLKPHFMANNYAVAPTKTSANRIELSRSRTSAAIKNNPYNSPHVKVHLVSNTALNNSFSLSNRQQLGRYMTNRAITAVKANTLSTNVSNMLLANNTSSMAKYIATSGAIARRNTAPLPLKPLWSGGTSVLSSNTTTNTANRLLRGIPPATSSYDYCLRMQYNAYVKRAELAKRKHTIFWGVRMRSLQQALLRRGWLQLFEQRDLLTQSNTFLLIRALRGDAQSEAALLSRILEPSPAYFVWQATNAPYRDAHVLPYRNRIQRSDIINYRTKRGLIGCFERQHWWAGVEEAQMTCPRTYRLNKEDCSAFMEDFQQTQCISLLRYLCKYYEYPQRLVDQRRQSYDLKYVRFALDVLEHLLRCTVYCKDTCYAIQVAYRTPPIDLLNFQNACQAIVLRNAKLRASVAQLQPLQSTARNYLAVLYATSPAYMSDGYNNLWLCKPSNSSCGHGIVLKNDIRAILGYRTAEYIVQKYIERPLLIYNTKFDIRQHALLVIGANTLSLWLYDDCYLRFSSQLYNLDSLQESIHLTNNAVQKHYRNQAGRDKRLPNCNMWSLAQFQRYLYDNNAPADTWPRIFDGFRRNILAVVLSSLEEMNLVQNGFEIYGVDFMLDEDYQPILIELNTTPDLRNTTEITGALCPRVQEDMIKVIVDLPQNPQASTGGFVKLYEMNYDDIAPNAERDSQLKVEGSTMPIEEIAVRKTLSQLLRADSEEDLEVKQE